MEGSGFWTVCFERVVLSSPGCLWPGRMDNHEEVPKHMPELIVVKLEKAEALRGEGMSTAQACRVLVGRAKRAFEAVAGPSRVGKGGAAGVDRGKLLSPARRHEAVSYLVGQGFSQRLARVRCWAVAVSVLPGPRGGRGENAA